MRSKKETLNFIECRISFIALLTVFLMIPGISTGQDKPHPTLVDIAASNCVTCHDDLTDKKVVHPVIKDSGCDACHEMKKVEKKIVVGFAEKGSALCFACHSEIESLVAKKFPHAVVEEGCETCHNPHSSNHKNLLVSPSGELCASCHETGDEDFKKKHGSQPVVRLGCGTCHNPHGSDNQKLMAGSFSHVPFGEGECNACHKRARGTKIRLRSTGSKMCYACHSDKETEFKLASTHTPIKNGDCTGCHDPHQSNIKYILKNKGTKLCLGCHENIAVLLKTENVHPPAKDSCQDCHSPHASNNAFQLTDGVVTLCLNCHDAEDEAFAASHYNQKSEDLLCTECHNPHGSKNKKLMNTFVHPPFAEKECDSCHENTKKDKKIKLAAEETNDLCLNCHDDKANDDSKKGMIQHGAIETEGCIVCHSAHASSQDHLLKRHASTLCSTCHDEHEKKRKMGLFIHPVIDSIGCQACHDSHYSRNKKLLLDDSNQLCLTCHLKKGGKIEAKPDKTVTLFGKIKMNESLLSSFKKIRLGSNLSSGHPMVNHIVRGNVTEKSLKKKRIKGLTFQGEMSCLSCHDPHAGASPKLFIDGIAGRFQLCLKCHKK